RDERQCSSLPRVQRGAPAPRHQPHQPDRQQQQDLWARQQSCHRHSHDPTPPPEEKRSAKEHVVPSFIVERPKRTVTTRKRRQRPALTEEYRREGVAEETLCWAQAQYRSVKLGID